eukprot:629478-Prymnesium_polylepis.1
MERLVARCGRSRIDWEDSVCMIGAVPPTRTRDLSYTAEQPLQCPEWWPGVRRRAIVCESSVPDIGE